MKSIELTAHCVREYDVTYTVVLDENDPMIQEMLFLNSMTFEDLAKLDFADNRQLWDNLMSTSETDVKIDEDFAPAEERFVDFNAFISENENA